MATTGAREVPSFYFFLFYFAMHFGACWSNGFHGNEGGGRFWLHCIAFCLVLLGRGFLFYNILSYTMGIFRLAAKTIDSGQRYRIGIHGEKVQAGPSRN